MGVLDDVFCNNDLFGDHKGRIQDEAQFIWAGD